MPDPFQTGDEGGSLPKAEALARFVPGCDPLNSTDLAHIARQLEDLRISLRSEGADLEEALCGLADRVLELVGRHGHIGGRQALDLILEIVEQVRTAVGGEPEDADASADLDAVEEDPLAVLRGGSTLGLRLIDQRRLGEILVSLSMLSQEQVERALRHQKVSGRRFGETLVELGFLSEAAVDTALRLQARRTTGGPPEPWMRKR
jgi:hypothetical protein